LQSCFVEDIAEALRDEDGKCLSAIATISTQQLVGYGFEKNPGHGFQGFPVIGQQHQIMAASGCESSPKPENYCPWDRRIKGLLFYDDSAAIPMRSLRSFIGDMKALRDSNPAGFCGLDVYTGFYIRFVKQSGGAYLGAQEDVAMVDFTYYLSTKNDSMPRLNGDIFDEIEQTAFFKYNAKPHWGKNRNYAFAGVAKSYAAIDKFLAAKARFDPQGFLSNEWTDAVLGIAEVGGTPPSVTTVRPSCAIEGLCVCTQDVHCAPEKNYFCRQGRVYPGANVCRFEVTILIEYLMDYVQIVLTLNGNISAQHICGMLVGHVCKELGKL
jgi:L-gulonolactone oxidase